MVRWIFLGLLVLLTATAASADDRGAPDPCDGALFAGPVPTFRSGDFLPAEGVFALAPTTLLSLGRILLIPFGWRKVVRWSYREYRYAFVHTMSADEQRAIWDNQIVPDSGRPFFEAVLALNIGLNLGPARRAVGRRQVACCRKGTLGFD